MNERPPPRRTARGTRLTTRKGFESFVTALPAVTLCEQWEASVAKVGGKVFALVGLDGGEVVFKVSETAFIGLTTLAGIAQARYFARGQWVAVSPGAGISDDDLGAYLREAHRIIAGKLTRRARAELGLAAGEARSPGAAADRPAISRRSST